MKNITRIILSLLAVTLTTTAANAAKVDQCATCHQGLDKANAAIVERYKQDIHFQKGLTCASCHGGNAALADEEGMDPDLGFVGVPTRAEMPAFCGKCHSDANFMRHYNPRLNVDQAEKYRTSHHGRLLAQGDKKVATCVSCHGVHGILPADNTASPVHKHNVPATCGHCHSDKDYMAGYRIPTNQFAEYSRSVHGVALLQKNTKGAPGCNDCHGNHGAAPPGVDDVAAVCVMCHTFNGELFNRSPHKDAFHAAGISQCSECHNHHDVQHPTDALLGIAEGSLCIKCHSAGDAGYRAAETMKQMLDSLLHKQDAAKLALAHAKSLDMDITDGEFALEDLRANLIESRTAVHAFSVAEMAAAGAPGFAAAARADSIAQAAVFEHKFRRTGFGIASLILTGFALLLWLKIRRIERRKQTA